MSDGGKGSKPRPFSVSNEEYANRWDAIFGRDKDKPNELPEILPQTVKENVDRFLEISEGSDPK